MNKFIKCTRSNGKPILISVDNISAVYDWDTMVRITFKRTAYMDATKVDVKETVEEVHAKFGSNQRMSNE